MIVDQKVISNAKQYVYVNDNLEVLQCCCKT